MNKNKGKDSCIGELRDYISSLCIMHGLMVEESSCRVVGWSYLLGISGKAIHT